MAKKELPADRTCALQGDLDVFSIHGQQEALRTQLSTAKAKTASVVLDLSGIGDVDLSGIQLLLILKRDLETGGAQLRLSGVKAEWAARFQPMDLGGLLEQP